MTVEMRTKLAVVICASLLPGLSTVWGQANPDDPIFVFNEGMALLKKGDHERARERILKATAMAEEREDYGSAYWFLWKLAGQNSEEWDTEQQLRWYNRVESYLHKRDRNHHKWRYVDLPNLIQVLCEKETVLSRLGRVGEGYIPYAGAEHYTTELLGNPPNYAKFKLVAANAKGVYLNLLADRAGRQELSGQLKEAEQTYLSGLEFIRAHQDGVGRKNETECRLLNNCAVLLSLMGRDDESDKYHEMASSKKNDGGAWDLAEVSRLRRESRTQGPSEELLGRLREKRERLWKRKRYLDALATDRRMASVLFEAGRHEEAMALFETVIEEASNRKYWIIVANAHLWRAKARVNKDPEGAERDFVSSLEFYRREATKPREFRVYHNYARYLEGRDRLEEALRMAQDSLRLNEFMDSPWLRPDLLALKARILYRMGHEDEAERAWQEGFRIANGLDDLSESRRLSFLMARLDYLAGSGRSDDAKTLKKEIGAFLDTADLTDYQKRRFLDFDPENEKLKQLEVPPLTVDLQPLYMSTRIQGEGSGRARFWLVNPNESSISGSIVITNTGASWQSAVDGSLVVNVNGEKSEMERQFPAPLTVDSDEVVAILCEGKPSVTGAAERVNIGWESDGYARTACWDLMLDEPPGFTANVNASLLTRNAFYSVPMYHEVGAGEPANFRVRATTPCRVEVYNLAGDLIAIDADADGSFLGVGDLLCADSDLDGHPESGDGVLPLAIHVFLAEDQEYGDRFDVVLEVEVDGRWLVCGTDRLLLKRE